jgi:glycosyl transferase family 25
MSVATVPKVLFINLDSSTDRRSHMEAELGRAGLPFERVAGIPGAALPERFKPYFCTADGRIASMLKLGEVGCHAAHLAAYERFLAGAEATALVLEDDVHLPDDLASLLAEILAKLPSDWEIVRLSNTPKRAYVPLGEIAAGYHFVRYSKVPTLASAYLLSRAGAQKLLAPGLRVHAIDEYLRRPWLMELDTFGVVPPPITLMSFDSNIDAFEDRRRQPSIGVIRKTLGKADLANLARRLGFDMRNIGIARWSACFAINAADKLVRRMFHQTLIHRLAPLLRRTGG